MGMSGTTVNNKRVFCVQPHRPIGFGEMLGARGDVRLDMLEQKAPDQAALDVLVEAGAVVTPNNEGIRIARNGAGIRPVKVSTAPFPGFPTDLQAQLMALMTCAKGASHITETIFENRFMHVQELVRLGADITPKTRVAVVRGQPNGLTAAPVMATDLRASASLVLAGLVAEGETIVGRIYHLDRGYENLEEKLASLGADVRRV